MYKILIIEDDLVMAGAIKKEMEAWGNEARYVEDFAKAGADILTVHVEACENLVETVDKIHACGMKAGVSIKPNTPVSALEPVLDKTEMFRSCL